MAVAGLFGLAAEHDRDDPAAIALGGRGDGIAGHAKIAGFQAVAPAHPLEQAVVGLHREGVVAKAAFGHRGVFQRLGQFHDRATKGGEIAGGGHIGQLAFGGRQPVNRMKGGVFHAEFARLGIHQGNKRLAAPGTMFSEGDGGIVGRLDHQGEQQVVDGELFALFQVHLGSAHVRGRRAGGHDIGQADFALLNQIEHDIQVHQLKHAGGISGFDRVFHEQRFAAVSIDHDGADVRVFRDRFQRGAASQGHGRTCSGGENKSTEQESVHR